MSIFDKVFKNVQKPVTPDTQKEKKKRSRMRRLTTSEKIQLAVIYVLSDRKTAIQALKEMKGANYITMGTKASVIKEGKVLKKFLYQYQCTITKK